MKRANFMMRKPGNQTIKRFHQFIKIERGPVNTAIIDLLEGEVFHVPNVTIDKFNAGDYHDIKEFMTVASQEKWIINVEPFRWIPEVGLDYPEEIEDILEVPVELHLEEGVPLKKVLSAFDGHPIGKIFYYGKELPEEYRSHPNIELKVKNFDLCVEKVGQDGEFCKIHESTVQFNLQYNSCWGTAIAITADGIIRPCIHSLIEIGYIDTDLDDIEALIEKMEPYWTYKKDQVIRCRDCEFRHICFDCREIAMRKTGEMDGANPLCGYNPYTGEIEDLTDG